MVKQITKFIESAYSELSPDHTMNPAYFQYMARAISEACGTELDDKMAKLKSKEPLKRLSILFTSVVDFERGFTPIVTAHLPDVRLGDDSSWIVPAYANNSTMEILVKGFKLKIGMTLGDRREINKTLSALVACRLLAGTMDDKHLSSAMEILFNR